MMTTASIVLCTRNQAPRLRLALAALSRQSCQPREIVIVDDASDDETPDVVAAAQASLPVVYERLSSRSGSPGARNAGARLATGDLLVFIDGDVLVTEEHVERHLAAHARLGPAVVIGPLWHTTTTEFLLDPATGTFLAAPVPPEVARRVERAPAEMLVTEHDVTENFSGVVARSAPGSYPGLGHMERAARGIAGAPHPAAWVLMTPQNASLPRAAFEDLGGFDATLPFCEGWDLTLRAEGAGLAAVRIEDAPIFHLYHHRPLDQFSEALRRWQGLTRIADKLGRRSLLFVALYFHYQGGDPFLPRELGPLELDDLGAHLRARDDLGPFEPLVSGHPLLCELEEAVRAAS